VRIVASLALPAVAAREPEVPSGIERDKTGTASLAERIDLYLEPIPCGYF
jgi:hypothetical protein